MSEFQKLLNTVESWKRLHYFSNCSYDEYTWDDTESVIYEAFPDWTQTTFYSYMAEQDIVNDVFRHLRLRETEPEKQYEVDTIINKAFLEAPKKWQDLIEAVLTGYFTFDPAFYEKYKTSPQSSALLLHREWMKNQGFTTIAEEPETEAEISSAEQLKYLIWSPPKPTKSANMVKAPE